jgi:hypothetical protein
MVKQLIIMAYKSSYGFNKQLKSPNLKSQTKCMLRKTVMSSTITYGIECLSLSKKKGNMFRIFDQRILRMISGPVNGIAVWRTG